MYKEMGLLVTAIVIGLQTVGVILMSAMLIAPAVAARQWTNHMYGMVILSAIFSVISGIVGTMISSLVPKMPTGPVIVIGISTIAFLSILIAPNRGILWKKMIEIRNRRRWSGKTKEGFVEGGM